MYEESSNKLELCNKEEEITKLGNGTKQLEKHIELIKNESKEGRRNIQNV